MRVLDAWCTRSMRSRRPDEEDRPEPAASSASDPQLVPGGTISSGIVEGFNGKVKLTTRKAFGFRTPQGIKIALFRVFDRLREPKFTHSFC